MVETSIAALLRDLSARAEGGVTQTVAIDLLEPNPYQPRTTIHEDALRELTDSIRERGILQPLLVRPHPGSPGRFQIIAGERRWRAAGRAGLTEVPVLRREMSDHEAAAAALVENLQRQDLNPMEEAEGFQRLAREFQLTHDALGRALGKSRAHVGNIMRLTKLPAVVQTAVRSGALSFGHARALLGHPDPDRLLPRVLDQGLSVRQTEALVARETQAADQPRPEDPDTRALERRVEDATGYRTRIDVSRHGAGRVVIRVSGARQLEALIEKLLG